MTVRDSLLRFALRVDPKDKDGVIFSSSTIGVSDGDKFPKQRLLDMYNDARYIVFQALSAKMPLADLMNEINQAIVDTTITFTSGTAQKPSGYLKAKLLTDSVGVKIEILPANLMSAVRTGNLPSFVETAVKRFVFEVGVTFKHLGGVTNLSDGAGYRLTYVGLPIYTLADVTGGVVMESYNDQYGPLLLEIGEALVSEQGYSRTLAIAESFLGKAA